MTVFVATLSNIRVFEAFDLSDALGYFDVFQSNDLRSNTNVQQQDICVMVTMLHAELHPCVYVCPHNFVWKPDVFPTRCRSPSDGFIPADSLDVVP